MDVLDTKSQKKYRSGIGMLLYLTKYSGPDISNIVQELSKCTDSATWEAYNELLRVFKFVIDTKTFGLKVQPKLDNNLGWDLKIFCDSDWAGDPKTMFERDGIYYLLVESTDLLAFQVTKRSDFIKHRGRICRNFRGC
jgi:hypothetical protein